MVGRFSLGEQTAMILEEKPAAMPNAGVLTPFATDLAVEIISVSESAWVAEKAECWKGLKFG